VGELGFTGSFIFPNFITKILIDFWEKIYGRISVVHQKCILITYARITDRTLGACIFGEPYMVGDGELDV